WRDHAAKYIASIHPDIVIVGSSPTYSFSEADWTDGSKKLLSVLSPAAGHIYVVRGTPALAFDGPDCLLAQADLPKMFSRGDRCHSPSVSPQNDLVYRSLQHAASAFDNVSLVDMNDALCPDGQCHAELNGHVVFRDSQHVTASFVASLSDAFAKRLGALESAGQPSAGSPGSAAVQH
ncbi:SGNH hydrolase domain-containing protein, partial [Dyella silvatica]|uniref:SGNH hydrolase domain-containing protein n=1 Tax=Dyella silvatica TaxID=2992128 RepID=UPI002255C917